MKKISTLIFILKKTYLSFKQEQEWEFSLKMSDDELTEMEKAGVSPSPETIQKIIDFARTYDVLETASAGQIEMNLN